MLLSALLALQQSAGWRVGVLVAVATKPAQPMQPLPVARFQGLGVPGPRVNVNGRQLVIVVASSMALFPLSFASSRGRAILI